MSKLGTLKVRLEPGLEISMAGGQAGTWPGQTSLGLHRGGSQTLLGWLETQLGLPRPFVPRTLRVAAYCRGLERAGGKSYAASFETDRWCTARALLRLRDQLLLSGWDGKAHPGLPAVVKDLALVEAHAGSHPELAHCEAARLKAVLGCLDAGQRLPGHEVVLAEDAKDWPKAWRPVLAKLNSYAGAGDGVGGASSPCAKPGTALHDFESRFLGKDKVNEAVDDSLTWWRALSVFTAADAVAASLASLGAEAKDTVILCPNTGDALILEDALVRHGVAPMGVPNATLAHPALQVLPLWLGLSWEPVDPGLLLDFLNLPISPIPGLAARLLAEAVAAQPGIGGREWNKALEKIASFKDSGDDEFGPEERAKRAEKIQERLKALRDGGLIPRGNGLPQDLIAQRCAYLAKWAAGYAAHLEQKAGKEGLLAALKALSRQAAALPELARAFSGPVSEPQLQRLLSSIGEDGIGLESRPASVNGPTWISSLAELPGHCGRLIWFGLDTGDLPASPWTAREAASLESAGIDLDFARREHLARRHAERSAMLKVGGPMLAVQLASAAETRLHPVWLLGSAVLGDRRGLVLEKLLSDGKSPAVWPLPGSKRKVLYGPAPKSEWRIPARHLKDRDHTSASELETRLGCPLKWVFQYIAKLDSSAVAQLPPDFILKGSFSHDLIEEVFGAKPATREAAIKAITELFDSRLPTEAATLAQPDHLSARIGMRSALARAAGAFFDLIEKGRFEIVGFEFTPKTSLFGRDFQGRLDCLLKDDRGHKAVVDLKYAGRKYRDLLEEGNAIQLAVYAAATAGDKEPVAAGYFIIDRAQLWTPEKRPVPGAGKESQVPGPTMKETWERFKAAIEAADGWLKTGHVPVRPLQQPDEWPEGAEMAIRDQSKNRFATARFSVCEYCRYRLLCGLEVAA